MIVKIILAILAAYRLGRLIPNEDGPLFIFERLRAYTDWERLAEQQQEINQGPWASLDEGLRCPYCVGMWAALLMAILIRFPTPIGDILLWGLGIAGGQTLLQERKDYQDEIQTKRP